MSARKDINDGFLIYTCNCGWLDKGHANPTSSDFHMGASNLWRQMTSEHYATKDTLNRAPCFRVYYKQSMRKYGMTAAVEHAYLIKKDLPIVRKQQIALRIFLEVSFGFETLQNSFPTTLLTNSGFSVEDLISNVIGFYTAVRNLSDGAAGIVCAEVSKGASLALYDRHFPKDGLLASGIGSVKNFRYDQPVHYPCDECASPPLFPAIFLGIKSAPDADDFIRYRMLDSAPDAWVKIVRPRNFGSDGRVVK